MLIAFKGHKKEQPTPKHNIHTKKPPGTLLETDSKRHSRCGIIHCHINVMIMMKM